MAPGRLDALTKEMIALAVSATNSCTYCIRSHTAAARKLGMDDGMLGELMAVVGTFNHTNKLADGYQVAVDPQLMAATEGAGRRRGSAGSAARGTRASPSARRSARPRRARRTPEAPVMTRRAAPDDRAAARPSPPAAPAARVGGGNALRGIAADVRLDLLLLRDARLDPLGRRELHPFEIAFFRNVFALVVIVPWFVRYGLAAPAHLALRPAHPAHRVQQRWRCCRSSTR